MSAFKRKRSLLAFLVELVAAGLVAGCASLDWGAVLLEAPPSAQAPVLLPPAVRRPKLLRPCHLYLAFFFYFKEGLTAPLAHGPASAAASGQHRYIACGHHESVSSGESRSLLEAKQFLAAGAARGKHARVPHVATLAISLEREACSRVTGCQLRRAIGAASRAQGMTCGLWGLVLVQAVALAAATRVAAAVLPILRRFR